MIVTVGGAWYERKSKQVAKCCRSLWKVRSCGLWCLASLTCCRKPGWGRPTWRPPPHLPQRRLLIHIHTQLVSSSSVCVFICVCVSVFTCLFRFTLVLVLDVKLRLSLLILHVLVQLFKVRRKRAPVLLRKHRHKHNHLPAVYIGSEFRSFIY